MRTEPLPTAILAIVLSCATGSLADASTPLLEVTGMTFVASREHGNSVVLKAESATFDTDAEVAHLVVVEATIPSSENRKRFQMTCDESDVDLATNNFIARGNVVGRTDEGLRFTTDRVDYDHEKGELSTNSPVLISEAGVSYRGGGFVYLIRENRFTLRGGASVVQEVDDVNEVKEVEGE